MPLNEETLHINAILTPKIVHVPGKQCYFTKKVVLFLRSEYIWRPKLLF